MKTLFPLLVALLLCCALTAHSEAASCWRVTGWSSPSVTANAIVVPASCATVPINFSWAPVVYSNGAPVPEDLWLIFDLTDSRIEGRFLKGVLFFDHFDTAGTPVVMSTILTGPSNTTQLWPIPPVQGAPVAGAVVRLRHVDSGNCLRNTNVYEPTIPNYVCSHDLKLSYVLDSAGDGTLRLRNEQTNQCLYASGSSNLLYSAACWASPAMRFTLYGTSGGYRLRHVATNKCVVGNAASGDYVHTATCASDPQMTYRVDIIHY